MPFKDILYNLSYRNLVLYGAVIPSFDTDGNKNKRKSGDDEETLWVDDPANRNKAIEIIQQMV